MSDEMTQEQIQAELEKIRASERSRAATRAANAHLTPDEMAEEIRHITAVYRLRQQRHP